VTTNVIAIDGPSGSGKSTVSRGVASALGVDTLDTGAMYRAVTLAVLIEGLDPQDSDMCARVARDIDLEVGARVLLGDEDVTAQIRGPEVTAVVSQVSAHPEVRDVLVERQRRWLDDHEGGVVEGRDIGTVVFPDAMLKIFLTASDEERARRRQRDEVAADRSVDVADVREDLDRRDRADSSRSVSPLRPADDAHVIDTSDREAPDVVSEIVDLYQRAASRTS
jgi:cytidylate kinase